MARALWNKENIQAPDSDYPYGRIRNKIAGVQSGTPVNEEVYGDFHQFFARLMSEAGIEENGQADNNYTGFQLYEALLKTIAKKIGVFSNADELVPTSPSSLDSYIYAGIFNVDPYTLDNDPGLDGLGQLIVSGNYDTLIVQRLKDLTTGAEWKRTITGGVFGNWTIINYAKKRINIGDWNMDSTAGVNIDIGLPATLVKKVQVWIKSDPDIVTGHITMSDIHSSGGGYLSVSQDTLLLGNSISLNRVAAGFFDSTTYDQTSYNRGYIDIEYETNY